MPKYTYAVYRNDTVIVEANSDHEGRIKLIHWDDKYSEDEKRTHPDPDVDYRRHSIYVETVAVDGESIDEPDIDTMVWRKDAVDSIGE